MSKVMDVDWFKSALNAMRDLVLIKGPNSRILWANRAFRDFYGMSEQDLMSMIDGPQSNPDDTLQYVRDDQKVFDSKKHLNIESEIVTNYKGESLNFHTVKSPIVDEGEVVRQIGISRLIENESKAPSKGPHSENKEYTSSLRHITSNFPVPMVLLDINKRIVNCSPLWESTFGVISNSPNNFFEEVYEELNVLGKELDFLDQENSNFSKEIWVCLNEVEYCFSFAVSLWMYPNNEVGGVTVVATDITILKQKKRELRIQSKKYKELYEKTPIMMHALNKDKEIELVSNAWLDVMGYSRDEVVGKKSLDFLTEESRELAKSNFNEHYEKGYTDKLELQFVKKDGSVLDVLLSASTEKIDGTVVRSLGVLEDITEMKKSGRLIKELNSRLTLALKASEIGVWDWDVVNNNLVWDDQMYKLYGVDPAAAEAYETWYNSVHPEDRDSSDEEIQRALSGEEKFDTEFRVILSSGEVRYIRALATVYFNERGEALQMIGVNWDITEEKKIARDLKESNERYEMVAESISVGIWDWHDMDDPKVFWSPRFFKLIGYDHEQLKPDLKLFKSILHPDDVGRTFALLDSHLEGKESFSLEYRLKTKEQGYRWFFVTGTAFRDSNGKPLRMVGSIQDMHEEKIAKEQNVSYQEKLESSNRELERFAYVASHDLQEPLRTISSFISVLDEMYGESFDETGKKYFGYVTAAAKRMRELITDLLAFSRIGKQEPKIEEVMPNDLITNLLQDVRGVVQEKGAHIQIDDLHTVYSDPIKISMVFQNLILNAMKFSGDRDPVVKVSSRDLGSHIEFAVEDNGIGMDEKFSDQIFVIFKKLHSQDQYEGTGLGLAICKKVVEMYGGKIWVKSKLGEGATFFFTISKTPEQSGRAAIPERNAS